MQWHQDDVRWAFRIFLKLLKDKKIDEKDAEYIHMYQRTEVRDVIEEIIEKEANVKIFEAERAMYLTPGIDNTCFGYTNAEIREKMKLKDNSELYLAYFVILCLLAKFYNSDSSALAKCRYFVTIEELERTITEHVDSILKDNLIEEKEERYRINFRSVAEVWKDLMPFDEKLVHIKSGRNNRVSFILRVINFLENEGLATVSDDLEVRILPKLEHIVEKYYFNTERKEELIELLKSQDSFKTKGSDVSATDQPHKSSKYNI